MAEEKKERTLNDVQGEYNRGCLRAGHLQYQILTLQKDLSVLNDTLRDLNFEASGIQAKLHEEELKKEKEEAAKAQVAAPELPKLEGMTNG